MNPLTEITKQRSLRELTPPKPENFDELTTEEQSFYIYIGYVVRGLESARTYIQGMRHDLKTAARHADDAYNSASDNAKTKDEHVAAKLIKERTDEYLKDTAENLKYVTKNLSECIRDMRPLLRAQDLF